jgi:hypothetical protein
VAVLSPFLFHLGLDTPGLTTFLFRLSSCHHVVAQKYFHSPSNSQREHRRKREIFCCHLEAQTTRTLLQRPNYNKGELGPKLPLSFFLISVQLSSNKRTSLPLHEITQLERSDLADYSLLLVLNHRKNYNLAFASDSELYDWQDDIYQRCPLGNYSAPFDFVHKAHIGGDAITGTFSVSFGLLFYIITLPIIIYIYNLGPQHIAYLCRNYRRPPLIREHRHRPSVTSYIRSASIGCAHHRKSPFFSTQFATRHSRRPVLDKTDWNRGFRTLYLEREASNAQSKLSGRQGVCCHLCCIIYPLSHSFPGIWSDAEHPISQSHTY